MSGTSLPEVSQSLSGLARFCSSVKELLEKREGVRGTEDDRSVLISDLEDWGFPSSEVDVYGISFMPATAMAKAGDADPDLEDFLDDDSLKALAFDSGDTEELFFTIPMPYGYHEGEDVTPVALWAPSDDGIAGGVVWAIDLSWASPGKEFPAVKTITATSMPEGTAYQHKQAKFDALSGTGKQVGSIIQGRVYRDTDHASDGYGADAFLLGLAFVYARNSVGAREAFAK